jgi:hypothetical protein
MKCSSKPVRSDVVAANSSYAYVEPMHGLDDLFIRVHEGSESNRIR